MRLWSLRNILFQINFWKSFLWRNSLTNILLTNFFWFPFVLIFIYLWFLCLVSFLTWSFMLSVFLAYLNAASFLLCFHLAFFCQINWKTFCSWDVLWLVNICRWRDISWFIWKFGQWFCTWLRFWSIWFLTSKRFISKVRFRYITYFWCVMCFICWHRKFSTSIHIINIICILLIF